MADLVVAFFGDVVGGPGRRAFTHAAQVARERHGAHVVIVNAENARHGSGLSRDGYDLLRRAGADALTLGDHCYREKQAIPLLEDPAQPLSRPANLAQGAPGKRIVRVEPAQREGAPASGPLYVVTVLGRLFMPMPSDDPFAALDREIGAVPEASAMVVVEAHAEASSEKQAIAWHCAQRWPKRVVAVLGTHTHVQTADARILEQCVGAVTDIGMCGPHRSIIGREVRDVLRFMTTQGPGALEVATDDPRACGALLRIDPASRRCVHIETLNIPTPQ